MKNSGMALKRIHEYVAAFNSGDIPGAVVLLEEHLSRLQEQRCELDHFIEVTGRKIPRLNKSLT
ncbi:hypothetical protein [Microbulbifer sp. A4B17]|uniref:hypothetical protein n=1 Tax=Microbulbifer sp. A4B17 TaxID=359370 RepID=UPI00192D9096|nr:hypothetical protein [Microbulbifer sp. A4B17]